MERLTHREEDWYWKNEEFWLSAENPSLEKVDDVYYKLAEFENFMEEQGFESLEELKDIIHTWTLYRNETGVYYKEAEKEKKALKDRWQKLKEYAEYTFNLDKCNLALAQVLDKMQELEKEIKC